MQRAGDVLAEDGKELEVLAAKHLGLAGVKEQRADEPGARDQRQRREPPHPGHRRQAIGEAGPLRVGAGVAHRGRPVLADELDPHRGRQHGDLVGRRANPAGARAILGEYAEGGGGLLVFDERAGDRRGNEPADPLEERGRDLRGAKRPGVAG